MKILYLLIMMHSLSAHSYKAGDLYSLNKTGLSLRNQKKILQIIEDISNSSVYQQIEAVKKVIVRVEVDINQKVKIYEAANKADQGPIGFALQVLSEQKIFFLDFIRISSANMSWRSYVFGYGVALQDSAICFFKTLRGTPTKTVIDRCADDIYLYAKLERSECFLTYSRALYYFVFQDRVYIPGVIKFWSHTPLRLSLLNQIKKYTSDPYIQAAATASIVGGIVSTVGKFFSGIKGALTGSSGKIVGVDGKTGRNIMAPDATTGADVAMADDTVATLEAANALADDVDIGAPITKTIATVEKSTGSLAFSKDAVTTIAEDATAVDLTVGKGVTDLAESVAAEALANGAIKADGSIVPLASPQALEITDASGPAVMTVSDKALKILGGVSTDLERNAMLAASILARQEKLAQFGAFSEARGKVLESLAPDIKEFNATVDKQIGALTAKKMPLHPNSAEADVITAQITKLQALKASLGADLNLTTRTAMFFIAHPMLQMLVDMTLQMCAMMGGSQGVAWIEASRAAAYAQLQQNYMQMQTSLQSKLTNITAAAANVMSIINNTAVAQAAFISTQQNKLQNIVSAQQNLIMQTLVAANNGSTAFASPMSWDQYFYYAPMNTPGLSPALPSTSSNTSTVSVMNYQPLKQTFYQGSWMVAPISTSHSLKGTAAWVINQPVLVLPNQTVASSGSTQVAQAVVLPTSTQSVSTTPVNHTWYNIARRGNWGYDSTSNSFFQYQIYPNSTATYPQGGDPQEAGVNSVFTEYYPPLIVDNSANPFYEIQLDMTVLSGQSPWIAGVVFNQGRWISGLTNQTNQYRFCGLYQSASSPISFCAAETFFTATASNSAPIPTTPLAQIMASPSALQSINSGGASVIQNPLYPSATSSVGSSLSIGTTYRITIYTQPTQIFLILQQKNSDGTLKNIYGPVQIQNRNPLFFNSHSLGFISSGCSTQFSLIQPQPLVYTNAEIQSFVASLSSSAKA